MLIYSGDGGRRTAASLGPGWSTWSVLDQAGLIRLFKLKNNKTNKQTTIKNSPLKKPVSFKQLYKYLKEISGKGLNSVLQESSIAQRAWTISQKRCLGGV